MIYKLYLYLSMLPLNMVWFWAYSGFSRALPDHKRLKRLRLLKPRNGPAQIIMVQIANALWRLGRTDEALAQFVSARQSEENWGKRLNPAVSAYIVTYCDYCRDLIRFGRDSGLSDVQAQRYETLRSMPVPDSIKSYKLPLPPLS